jgi:PEP-CTERM motif
VAVTAGAPALWSVWHMSPSSPFDVGVEMRIEWRNSVSNTEIARTPNSVTVPTAQYTQFSVASTVPAGVDTARLVYAIQSFGPGATNTGLVFVDDAFYDAVPEPASSMLLALGAIGSVIFGRRSRS